MTPLAVTAVTNFILAAEGFFLCFDILGGRARERARVVPVEYRLPFRELGLSIGLRAVEKIRGLAERKSASFRRRDLLLSLLTTLGRHAGLVEQIKRFLIPVPPMEVQRRIVARRAAVRELLSCQYETLRSVEHLFGSLVHAAFRGELGFARSAATGRRRESHAQGN